MAEDNTKKIYLWAAIATIIGTFIACIAAFATFGNWLFPHAPKLSITETSVQILNSTEVPSTDEPLFTYPNEIPTNTNIPFLEPDSTFTPSQYSIYNIVDCIVFFNETSECIKNKLSIVVTSDNFGGTIISGTVSSPGYPSLEFISLDVGHSIYYHDLTNWFEMRFDSSHVTNVHFHVTTFRNR